MNESDGVADVEAEIMNLRRHLDELAAETDEALAPYGRWSPKMPPGLYWRLRWVASRVLYWLRSLGPNPPEHWPVALKQGPEHPRSAPLTIWALGTDRETLRSACFGYERIRGSMKGLAPVLITDVADFALYSRLGWLVEYVPSLRGAGEDYRRRKMRFLARLYGDAPALPVVAFSGNASADVHRWLELAASKGD